MPFASINPTNPRTNPWKFHEKILRIGGAGKWVFFWVGHFDFFFSQFFFLLHLNENKQTFHMRCHFFLHYAWFLQNLGKETVRTNMHTTVKRSKREFCQFSKLRNAFLFVWQFLWFKRYGCAPHQELGSLLTTRGCWWGIWRHIFCISLGDLRWA